MRAIDLARVLALAAGIAGFLAAAPDASGAASAPERKYQMLRYDEDWTWLESTPPTTPDAFDPVKHVRLSEEWTFLLGGSLRFRVESDSGKPLGAGTQQDDTQARARAFVHFELRHRKDFRWFTELASSTTFATDRKVNPLMEDDPDVHQLFVEGTFASATKHPVTLRAGRQELLFGTEKLVSPLDWSNTRRGWDGLAVIARTPRTRTTAFATRPVVREKHDIDSPSDDVSFSGVTVQVRPKDGHVVEAFAWLLHDSSGKYRSEMTGEAGDVDRQTWGARWDWKRGAWSGDVEGALQRGDASDDDISALMLTTTVGYQWTKAKGKPRLAFGLDHASGDDDPHDGDAGTFEAPFPLGHAYHGHVDLVGRKNVDSARVHLELWPAKGWRIDAAFHVFELAEAKDALYEAGNTALRRDVTGASTRDVGSELDVMARWTFRTHHSFGVELSRFWTGDFIDRTGPASGDVWWGWVGYELKF